MTNSVFSATDTHLPNGCGLNIKRGDTPLIIVDPDSQYKRGSYLGFNMNVNLFEKQIWRADERIRNESLKYLNKIGPIWYRYPGGIQANNYNWLWSIGAYKNRRKQKIIGWQESKKILFGLNEYFEFLKSVDGKALIVNNLVGWNENNMGVELSLKEIVNNNRKLAAFIKNKVPNIAHAYELGNELDRGGHQWDVKKYTKRANAVANIINKVDPEAIIIMPIREWNLTYHGKQIWRGKSNGMKFTGDVLDAMPSIDNFSFHYYYDPVEDNNGVFFHRGRLKMIERMINVVRSKRTEKKIGIWVTEHARKWEKKEQLHTSNLYSSISTSDFLIALTQIPEIRGVFWHELNAVHWKLFNIDSKNTHVQPRPIYWAFRVLNEIKYKNIISSCTISPFNGDYHGGYDIRSAVFLSDDKYKLGIWIINRAPLNYRVKLKYTPFKSGKVRITRYSISGNPKENPDDTNIKLMKNIEGKKSSGTFDHQSNIELQVLPFSVSSFILELQ